MIQVWLNQNDSVRITYNDDSTEDFTNSSSACLPLQMEDDNEPPDTYPADIKKITRLAGSPVVMIFDG